MYYRKYNFQQCHDSRYLSGKTFVLEVPHPGKYRVTATLKTTATLPEASFITGMCDPAFTESISPEISRQTVVVNIGNRVPEGEYHICQDRSISVTVTAAANCLTELSVREISCPAIYIAGSADDGFPYDRSFCMAGSADDDFPSDRSFCMAGPADDDAGSENDDTEPVSGNIPESFKPSLSVSAAETTVSSPEKRRQTWKQLLTAYARQEVAISDYSHPGITMESFRTEGHSSAIYEYSRPGDFCFFQFDPSGQPLEYWAPGGACRRQLARFILECRERLMYPVLLTPSFCHNSKNADDYISQLQKHCLDTYQEVSKLTATPVINLHTTYDALVTAGSVAREIARVCGAYPGRGYRFLAKCMGAD